MAHWNQFSGDLKEGKSLSYALENKFCTNLFILGY